MRPDTALTVIAGLARPHIAGHRCTNGDWYNDAVGARERCPVRAALDTLTLEVKGLHEQIHGAAHDDDAARAVAEGMTGLVLADLGDEEREGWTLAARMAIEALAAHLDRDPVLEARAAAVRERLAAAAAAPVEE